jgi:peptide/nickel transport system ATP-binding protein
MTSILTVENLSVAYEHQGESRPLLQDIDLMLRPAEIVGLVGESGSGKSLLCRAIIGLLPSTRLAVTGGSITLEDQPILGLAEREMSDLRGGRIGMIFQNPSSHLDPVMRIGDQICEGLQRHQSLAGAAAREEAINLLDQVGFPDPKRGFHSFAHEYSGGMRQRAMIAIALACDPDILIADEPTTALDVTIQAQILRLLVDLRDRRGLSIILITHDLGVVAQTCDRIAVMQNGRIVESGEKRTLLAAPLHPYSRKLIASHPSLEMDVVADDISSVSGKRPIFEIDNLEVTFPAAGGLFKKRQDFQALKDVSLQIFPGETVAVVGESGSGKSTLARAMMGLTPLASGHVTYDGSALRLEPRKTLARMRHDVAMVFQDPYNALNPRLSVRSTLHEVLLTQGETAKELIPARISELLNLVGLDDSFANRSPRSLSGGQCQRAGIARALAVNPKVIIADECVAALDVTIQAQIIALFRDLTERIGLTLIFIAHDLALVRQLCEKVVVMQHGKIVETGATAAVFAKPATQYTKSLIAAIPNIDPDISLGIKLNEQVNNFSDQQELKNDH